MIYLFKNRFSCTDVFKGVFEEMVRRGYECVRIIDEDLSSPAAAVEELIGREVTLVTSDHLNDNMEPYGKHGYSVTECVRLLLPARKFFGMHDLGISTVDDDLDGYTVLLPGMNWRPLFSKYQDLHKVGHGKFLPSLRSEKYQAIFFVSSVYVHSSHPKEFLKTFRTILDWEIPFKFPKYPLSAPLVEAVSIAGGHILDPNIESFDLLRQCHTAISNANSSIAVEASIAGCNSINFGWSYTPREVYEGFPILSLNDPGAVWTRESLMVEPPPQRKEFLLDLDRCINLITGHKTVAA